MAMITREMATRLTLDTSNAQSALRDFQREATSTTREWKSTTSQLKAAGDYAGAAAERLKGLGNTIGVQNQKISLLKTAIEGVNTSTKKGTDLYNFLQKELEKAERQLGSYTGQQERANSANRYYQSGLAELNQKLQRNSEIMAIREQRLQAQGREEAATQVHVNGLKSSQESLTSILKIQESELNRVARTVGKNSDAYHTQSIRVEETKKNLTESSGELKRYQSGVVQGEQRIKDLNATITRNNDLYQANAQRLETIGDHNGALTAKLAGAKSAFSKQNDVLKENQSQLQKLESAENVSRDAIEKQRVTVAKAEARLAGYQKSVTDAQREVDHLNPYGFSRWSQGMNEVYRQSNKMSDSMHKGFEKAKSGAISASIGVGMLGAAALKGAKMASELQNQYNTTYNLLVTGGEKAAEATKNVTRMQQEGRAMSVQYGVSQTKIAAGYQELVKRGYSSQQALGAMKTMLQGAVASGDDFNDVVHNSTATIESFGMKVNSVSGMTKNTKTVVNEMAYAADLTATDFGGLGKAMEYVGATAHTSKFSLAETSAAVGELSNRGLEADKAGTGLRKVMNSLATSINVMGKGSDGSSKQVTNLNNQIQKQTLALAQNEEKLKSDPKNRKEITNQIDKQKLSIAQLNEKVAEAKNAPAATDMLSKLGIKKDELVDANGNMKSLADIMAVLKDHTQGMNTVDKNVVFKTLFGTTGQQAGIILSDNAEKLSDLTDKVKKSADGQGYVAELSKRNMKSVKNEMKQFEEAANGALIMIGKAMLPTLRDASIQLAKTFNSKEGQQGLKILARGVADLFGGLETGVKFLATHTQEVKVFAATLATLWAVNKIGKFINVVHDAKNALLEFKEANAALDWTGGNSGQTLFGRKSGKSSKGPKSAIETSSEVGETATDSITSSAAKAAPSVGKILMKTAATGIGGGVISGISEAASNKPMHEKVGGTIGGGVGTAAGMAIGGPLGAMLGGTIGQKAGELLSDAVSRGIKKKPVSINFETRTTGMKKLDKDYQGFIQKLNRKLIIAPMLDTKGLSKNKREINKTFSDMSKSIDSFYKKKQTASKKDLDILVKNGALTKKQEDKILKNSQKSDLKQRKDKQQLLNKMQNDSNQYHNQLQKIASGSTDKLKKLDKNSTQYQKEQQRERKIATNKYQKSTEIDEKRFGDDMNKTTRTAGIKQRDILNDLKNKKGKISHEEMTTAIANSAKQKDTVVKEADETYKKAVNHAKNKRDEVIKNADREYYENGTISKKQHDDIVGKAQTTYEESTKSAKKQKDEIIGHASEQHKKVVDEATAQAGEHASAVDDETGNVGNTWNTFVSDIADIWNGLIDGVNWLLKAIDKDHPGHIDKWKPGNYLSAKYRNKARNRAHAQGHQGLPTDELALVGEEGFELAHDPQQGIFALGTDGPEIRQLKAGTSILPHNLSKQFMKMTAGLPAHKNGVSGLIDNAFNWTKDMFSDVGKIITDGPEKALKMITDKIGVDKFINNYSQSGTTAFVGASRGGIHTVTNALLDKLKGIFKKAEQDINATDVGAGGNWREQIEKAAKEAHVDLKSGDLNAIMARINKESGGRQNIKQQVYDINMASGNPAQGLLQYIPPTFKSWAVAGHTNILSGYDQLMAMFNDSNWASDIRMPGGWGPTGHRRLENGGITNQHQMVEISEGNLPEMTIPLSKMKDSRGYELLGKTVSMFAARDNLGTSNNSESQTVKVLENKVEKMIDLLSAIVSNTASDKQVVLDRNTFYQKQNNDRRLAKRQNLNPGY